jgi:hypothetical protein
LTHFASPKFWACYRSLPANVQELADKNFDLLKNNPHHRSLHFKKIANYRSVRVGIYYRALAVEVPNGLLWFWIGSHAEYDKILA